ncbi:MAG: HAMP domain-containing histidine kinase [Nisaea sp.]|uniref:sensor histidine kinase n=1 Tax=Nisaea sp. TaxID=2024842 RepID=UPI001B08308F|nr:HAMP domain-containing sensor histidine kinase [Nisaea sp.]MBO6562536.1 HAMP domain-containing histidine kinase [Nisaea sp.]
MNRLQVPFWRRLSVRQAQIAVIIGMMLGILFAAVQVLLDARDQRQNLSAHADTILAFASLPAARAAYRLDAVGAQELAVSLLNDPAVASARIVDELELPLANAIRDAQPAAGALERLLLGSDTKQFERQLHFENAALDVGKLQIELDPVLASPGFAQRTWNILLSGLSESTILAVALMLIYQWIITKRVTRLAESFSSPAGIRVRSKSHGDELDLLEDQVVRTTRALAGAVSEAQEANKAKSVFLASMSHEMRTPLNAVIGYAEALEMGIGVDNAERRNEYLKNIARAGRQLNRLLGDILDFSKIEAGSIDIELGDVSLAEVIRQDLPQFEEIVAGRHLNLSSEILTEAEVRGDRARIRQILLNFVTNAAKYNVDGGKVGIGCRNMPDGWVRLYVRDDGTGIPKSRTDSIFEPFVRGNNNMPDIPGAGLGLAICKMLAEGMHGRIGCDSAEGEGATFWIDLPRAGTLPTAH